MVSPYASKLYTEQLEKLGSRVGLLYAVSTLGSFIGTLAIGFWLIPNFHISAIILALAFALLLLPLIYFLLLRSPRWPLFIGAILLSAFAVIMFPSVPAAKHINQHLEIIYQTTSFYGEIKVLELEGQKRMLLVDGVTQSEDDFRTHHSAPSYVRDLNALLTRYQPVAKQALVIGLGGGNIIHALQEKGVAIDVVEIDKKILHVATTYFGIDPSQVKITLDDGRRFVRNCRKKYDIVVVNTFNGESSPTHMLSRDFFQEIKKILNPDGVMALNFVGFIQGPHRYGALAVYSTLRSAFGWCDTYFREHKQEYANILFMAGDNSIPPEPTNDPDWQELKTLAVNFPDWKTGVVCTDDYNPVDFLNRMAYQRWRQQIIDSVGPDILLN
jgi:spermidine synthase